jgi:D-glycero-D-manno-heptose 1,7-bisphosphate phosphatase
MSNRAIFLDRDGTINRDVGYAHRAENLRLIDNAVAGLSRMSAMGFALIIVTNQSGVARGYFTEADVHAFHQALGKRLRADGIEIAAMYYCPFHPTAGLDAYRRDSPLRKPKSGMLLKAAAEHGIDLSASYMIGDRKSDILAGAAAGCRTILMRTGPPGEFEAGLAARPDFVAHDLRTAALTIERVGSERVRLARAPLYAPFTSGATDYQPQGSSP